MTTDTAIECSTCKDEKKIPYARGEDQHVPCPECCAPPESKFYTELKNHIHLGNANGMTFEEAVNNYHDSLSLESSKFKETGTNNLMEEDDE